MQLILNELIFTVRGTEEELNVEQLTLKAINRGYSVATTKDAVEANSTQMVELAFTATRTAEDAVLAIDGALDIPGGAQDGMSRGGKLIEEAQRRKSERQSNPAAD